MRTILTFLLVISFFVLKAQNSNAYEKTIHGVKVIFYPVENDVMVIKTFIKGGEQRTDKSNAGLEALTLSNLGKSGSSAFSEDELNELLNANSARIYGETNRDFSAFTLNCIFDDISTFWPAYMQSMLNFKTTTTSFQQTKQAQISAIENSNANPDNAVNRFAEEKVFAGTSYKIPTLGTRDAVANYTERQLMDYWKQIFVRKNLLMVVVGKADATVESSIADFISKIPEVKFSESRTTKKFNSIKPSFFAAEREGTLNYIKGFFAGPEGNASDKLAFNTAVWLFEKEYMKTLMDLGLSYDCTAWIEDGRYNHGYIAASTVNTQRVMQVTDSLIQKYRNEGFTERQLKVIPYHASNIFYLVSQTNGETADQLVVLSCLEAVGEMSRCTIRI